MKSLITLSSSGNLARDGHPFAITKHVLRAAFESTVPCGQPPLGHRELKMRGKDSAQKKNTHNYIQ